MPENKRIKKAINWLISQGKFNSQNEIGQILGISNRSYLSQLVNAEKPNEDFINKFIDITPEINRVWLMTGEGNMLNDADDIPASDAHLVPLINIDSVGGIHSRNQITPDEQYVSALIPFPDARPDDVAIIQSGDSMSPSIPAGSYIQLRQVEDWQQYIGYGNVYVIWLTDGRRITKLIRRYDPDPKNYILCCSYNPSHDDEELPRSLIRQVWKVINILIPSGW